MAKGSRKQAGGSSAPLRRSSRAAVTSQVVSSAIEELSAATTSFRTLVYRIGSPRDTPDLRAKIHTMGDRIEKMIKDTLYQINKFTEPFHYDGASPAREVSDGELAKFFGEVIGEFQEVKLQLKREAPVFSFITQADKAGVPERSLSGLAHASMGHQLRAQPPPSLASTSYRADPPVSRSVRSSSTSLSSTHHHSGAPKLSAKGVDASIMIQDLKAMMKNKHNIRNVCMIADLDEGKSMVADMLIADAGTECLLDYDELELGVTTESTVISLFHELSSSALPGIDGCFLINLFESNFQCDSEPVRMSDGALLVIDCTGDVSRRTENVLGQALYEGLIPVLVLDKVDQVFSVAKDGEIAYEVISVFISGINNILAEMSGESHFNPARGTVAFSAASQRWAFTLADFAEQQASEYGFHKESMMELLWGDNFYDTNTRKWTTKRTSSPTCERGFVHFCYNPIMQNLKHRSGLKKMQNWLPGSPCLLTMMISHLPSPAKSQNDRLENLYEGPQEDRFASSIRNCDPTGPVLVYIPKMIQASAKRQSFAFGRVFSGTVQNGMKVRVMGPNYPTRRNDLFESKVTEVSTVIGKKILSSEGVPCGNTVAVRFDYNLDATNATITDEGAADAYPVGALRNGYYRLMPQGTIDSFFEIPSSVSRELAHHQDIALRWLWNLYCKGKGGILGDDMGMGKTRQVATFLLGLFHSQVVTSVIVVVPLTILKQWVEELDHMGLAKRLKIFSDSNVKSQSKQLKDAVKHGGILLTTYGLFTNHKTSIMGKENENCWDYIILDEGHKIKNMEAKVSIALNNVKCTKRIVMTGTPYQNNMKEFYALMNFACPSLLGDEDYFVQQFDNPIDKGKHKDAQTDLIGQAIRAFKKLEEHIGPHMLRRTKEVLLKQGILKKKQELAVWLKLAPHQAALYRRLINVPRVNTLGAFPECQVAENICNHPRILTMGSDNDRPVNQYSNHILKSDPNDDDLVESSCKVSFTLYLVKRLLTEGHKILIFSQSIPMLKILQMALGSVVDEERILYMDGDTPAKKRERLVEDFKELEKSSGDEKDLKNSDDKKEPLIFVMSTLVGGLGLNLVSASRVILVDPSKNPSTDDQTVDRVYRMGQEKVAVVYRLITCETVEEHIYRMQVLKGETGRSLTERKQTRRAVPRRNRRVLALPENNFSVSDTHNELGDEYKNIFDDDMIEEVRLVREHDLVMSVTNHSDLFTLDEKFHHFPLYDDDEIDEKMDVQKVSSGPCRRRNIVIGGSKDAIHPCKPASENVVQPTRWNQRGNDHSKYGLH